MAKFTKRSGKAAGTRSRVNRNARSLSAAGKSYQDKATAFAASKRGKGGAGGGGG